MIKSMIHALIYASLLLMAAHADTTQSVTQRLLKPVIALKCEQEISTFTLWKGAAIFMSEQQKQTNRKAICGCVSEHAMDDMAAQDLVKAAVSEAEKNKLVQHAIKNSLRGCAQQAFAS